MTKLRIFLADDHAVVREGLKSLINMEQDMEVVGEASDGVAALEQAPAFHPHVAVVDVSMPRLDGAELTRRLRHHCPLTQVLALTVHEDPGYVRQLLQAGANAYVLKRAAATELIQAIRASAAGHTYLDPALAAKGGPEASAVEAIHPSVPLSEREEIVARLIAQGYSNKEVAAKLEVSIKTIETYKARALKKLDLRSRADLVRHAVTQGWL